VTIPSQSNGVFVQSFVLKGGVCSLPRVIVCPVALFDLAARPVEEENSYEEQ
jgi:hypothetical protein